MLTGKMSREAGVKCISTSMTMKIFSVIFVFGISKHHCANASPIQYLPDMPGYIPVYIRHGDEPLEEINPLLAEAFNEPAFKIDLQNLREIKLSGSSENQNQDLTNKEDDAFNLKEEKVTLDNAKSSVPPKILIYTLPQDKQFTIRTSALPINKEITIKLQKK